MPRRRRSQYYIVDNSNSLTEQYNQIQDRIEEINDQLANQPKSSPKQRGYTRKYMLLQMSDKFDQLADELKQSGHGFRFNGNVREYFLYENQGSLYQVNRVLKLRFKCKNNQCVEFVQNDAQQKQRKWTTYYGLTCLQMYFDKNEVLRYYFKIYGQKCLSCDHFGSGQVIEKTRNNLVELYCLVLKEIFLLSYNLKVGIKLNNIEKQGKHPPSRKIGSKPHQSDLCEACSQGKCLYTLRSNKRKFMEKKA